MSLPAAYLSQNHTHPLPSKDGGVLRTIGAVTYMLALPRVRGELCQCWQQATQLILDQADVAAVSHQMHLALFYDAQLERHQGRRDSRVRSRRHHSWRIVIALCGDRIVGRRVIRTHRRRVGGHQAVPANKPRGVPRVNDRRVLNGIFWVLRSGTPWRDLPENLGP